MNTKIQVLILFVAATTILVFTSCSNLLSEAPIGYADSGTQTYYYPTCIEGNEYYENCYGCNNMVVIPHLNDNGKPIKCGKDTVKRTVYRHNK